MDRGSGELQSRGCIELDKTEHLSTTSADLTVVKDSILFPLCVCVCVSRKEGEREKERQTDREGERERGAREGQGNALSFPDWVPLDPESRLV